MQAFTGGLQENSFNISNFWYSYSSTAAIKWNKVAIKTLLLFEAGLLYLVLGWRKLRQGISTKVKVAGFYSRVQEKFLTSLSRFQKLPPRSAWVIITVFCLMQTYGKNSCSKTITVIELDLKFFLLLKKSVKYEFFWFLIRTYECIKGRFAFNKIIQ